MPDYIAAYILRSEYECRHCRKLPPDMEKDPDGEWPIIYEYLFKRFKSLREAWQRSIPITSGYRCPVHEHEITGSKLGPHIFGLALDLGISLSKLDAFANLVEIVTPELRMGINRCPGAVHIHIDAGFFITPRYSPVLVKGARWEE